MQARYNFLQFRRDHAAFVADVLAHEARRDKLLVRIGGTANRDKQRFLVRQFLNDPGLKLLYFLRSVQAKRLLAQFPPEEMHRVAQGLTATSHYFEEVRPVQLRAGAASRRRTTYSFGPRKHALQRMVADLLGAMFPLSRERHFTLYGGVRAALLAVEEHAREGFIYAVERDIAQFYPSVDILGLARLLRPLPGSVVKNVIAYRPGFNWSDYERSADAVHTEPLPPRGLLAQGSAASPVAAEVLMADLLRDMPDDVRIMSYADNVMIQGETSDSVEAASRLLEARAQEHPCGPLGLKPSKGVNLITREGAAFLGHEGDWNQEDGGRIRWRPNDAALDNVLRQIEGGHSEGELRASIRRLRNQQRGYPLWWNGEREVSRYLAELGARLAIFAERRLSAAYNEGLDLVVRYCKGIQQTELGPIYLDELLPDYSGASDYDDRRQRFIEDVRRRVPTGSDGTAATI